MAAGDKNGGIIITPESERRQPEELQRDFVSLCERYSADAGIVVLVTQADPANPLWTYRGNVNHAEFLRQVTNGICNHWRRTLQPEIPESIRRALQARRNKP